MRRGLLCRLGAHCAIVAMLFAQFAIVAYACPIDSPTAPTAMVQAPMHGNAGEAPCAGAAGNAEAPRANACEVHCNDGVTLPAQPDLPLVALAALPVPAMALAELATCAEASRTPHAGLPGAPPRILQFCRLLI
jgi:hypothetical protein